ncbi:unnamed protein product [Adineta steineri]|uniref:Uncharacterized protein n=1 Tax=Adineta steineri TaxID=433720 RepID=A0A815NS20_9BILA|nr:unnamed protein product [Adineta steineri]CAF3891599.1 unnamed protein product [Adineta steineri]
MTLYSVFLLFLSINCVYSSWITINDYSVTTWNETNADRSEILTRFQVTNYPSKYIKSLNNRIDTFTCDFNCENVYFLMQQGLYEISKFFKFNSKTKQVYQTEQIQSFMIDHIQFNEKTKKLYSIIHQSTERKHLLVEIDTQTLQVKEQLMDLSQYGFPMSGSYFNSKTQLFTYHAYDSNQQATVLITLDLSSKATQRFVQSKVFDFNVYGFGFVQSNNGLVALDQYNIVTPLVVIKINEKTGQPIGNVTITPDGQRIAQGYKPFSVDYENQFFYVLSSSEDLSKTFISKINIQTMEVNITAVQRKFPNDYLFVKIN